MSNYVDTVHECDRQTDGRTDGRTDRITMTKTVQRIASHGKNGCSLEKLMFDVGAYLSNITIRHIKCKASGSCYSIAYMSETSDQKCLAPTAD